jgi:hypothetical protein
VSITLATLVCGMSYERALHFFGTSQTIQLLCGFSDVQPSVVSVTMLVCLVS